MLLFWCSWFKYRLIKLDLVTVGKVCFNFSRVLDGVVDCVSVKPSTCALKLMLARCAERVRINKSRHPKQVYRPNLHIICLSQFRKKQHFTSRKAPKGKLRNKVDWVSGALKDVRANCFCASLLRTQIRMPRHA